MIHIEIITHRLVVRPHPYGMRLTTSLAMLCSTTLTLIICKQLITIDKYISMNINNAIAFFVYSPQWIFWKVATSNNTVEGKQSCNHPCFTRWEFRWSYTLTYILSSSYFFLLNRFLMRSQYCHSSIPIARDSVKKVSKTFIVIL